jgi:flavodoxin
MTNLETPGIPGLGRTLVAYFSRSGNTRVIAGLIHRALKTDLFEIVPAKAYPEDYEETVEQARIERDCGYERPLLRDVPGLRVYETVLLGFPIWGETAPPVIRAFLSSHDLAGRTVIPFITHGAYGLGNSLSVIAKHSPNARLRRGFSMQCDQERDKVTQINDWMKQLSKTEGLTK